MMIEIQPLNANGIIINIEALKNTVFPCDVTLDFSLALSKFLPFSRNGEIPSPKRRRSCPLSFSTLRTLNQKAKEKPSKDVAMNYQYSSQGLRLVLSEYLRSTGSFYPPPDSAESCWNSYESLVESIIPGFNVRSSCGFQTSWITRGCMNISTRSEFERLVPRSALADVVSNCNQSLEDQAPCTACLGSLNAIQASYLLGPSTGNISDCSNLPSIYAAAVINFLGPDDPRALNCMFCLYFTSKKTSHSRRKLLLLLILVVILVGSGSIFGGYFVFRRKRKSSNKHKRMPGPVGSAAGSALISWNFTFEQIKEATNNFHRDNLIGRGGFGNVYKATLPDGSEFAVKRFKNCSAVGDAEFSHEVESLASIRHINLVELRGYCVATTVLKGHQRFIVCDLMENGNLHDHLFGGKTKLSWPTR